MSISSFTSGLSANRNLSTWPNSRLVGQILWSGTFWPHHCRRRASRCRAARVHTASQEMLAITIAGETRIEAERLWPRDANISEVRMARIEKEIRLLWYQHTRYAKTTRYLTFCSLNARNNSFRSFGVIQWRSPKSGFESIRSFAHLPNCSEALSD
jgi:hypothetical protein